MSDDIQLLDVDDLSVEIDYRGERVKLIEDIGFSLDAGESLAIVGESGSGKTTLGLALLHLLPGAKNIEVRGDIIFEGRDVLSMTGEELSDYRGGGVATIFQDPMTSLNPTMTIGKQVGEAVRGGTYSDKADTVVNVLDAVGIPDAQSRTQSYAHQFSGGMRQRVVGAIGLAGSPRLLIADEPTTALDITVQLQFIDLLQSFREERNMALIFITHDMPLVARLASKIAVMYSGQIVEKGDADQILDNPKHWYTEGLIACAKGLETADGRFVAIEGQPPELDKRPSGCRFAPRCTKVQDKCATPPPMQESGDGHAYRCWFPREAS